MKIDYMCIKCKRRYPIEEVRYTETPKGFQLVCRKCDPGKWKNYKK